MARIFLSSAGSRGDVQPYVALGVGLREAGHSVGLATHRGFQDWIESHGIEYVPLRGDPEDMVLRGDTQGWFETGSNGLKFLLEFRRLMQPILKDAMADIYAGSKGADLLVGSALTYYPVYSIHQKTGQPWVQSYLQPIHPTSAYWSPLLPARWEPRALNKLSYMLAGQIFWHLMRPAFSAARREVLDLGDADFFGPFLQIEKERIPALYAFSPTVVPRPDDWADHLHVTGYWFLDAGAATYDAPPELRGFLESGAPPVYVGFGSMSTRDPVATTRMVVQALERAGARGILLGGWSGLAAVDLPESVIHVESAPHGWLFPRTAAVVHHGGAGTTAAGLRAGVPSVVVPFFGDQPFWAKRVHALGAGPEPIPRAELSADRLAAAIAAALEDAQIRSRANEVGRRIRAESGVAHAVRICEEHLKATRAL